MTKTWVTAGGFLWGLWGVASCSGVGLPIGSDEQRLGTGGITSAGSGGISGGGGAGGVGAAAAECLKPRPDNRGSLGGSGSNILMGRCNSCGWALESERCTEIVYAVPTTAFIDEYSGCFSESVEFADCLNGNPPPPCDERVPTQCAAQCAALAACW